MGKYIYSCPRCGYVKGDGPWRTECDCPSASGIQIINRTGDLGRPVTWAEKRQRESNARVQETVTNNSKTIQKETGQKHGAGLRRD